jgi:long-chain acyl-CoA synthetase
LLEKNAVEMNEKPWLDHYDADVPHTLYPYPKKMLNDIVAEAARERPTHPAILFKGNRIIWSELHDRSLSMASALQSLGAREGDRVALIMPNCPQFIISQLGAWHAGAIVSPLNPLYTEEEIVHALNETGAETAVVLTPFYNKVKALQSQTSLKRIIATNIKEYLPVSSRWLFTLFKEKKDGHRITLQTRDHWLQNLLHRYADAKRPPVKVGPDDPALLMFTGGTTGRSKAALSTHGGLLAAAMQAHAWLAGVGEDWVDKFLLLMPMFHTYGNVGVLSLAIVAHCPMVPVPNPRDLDDLVKTIDKERPAFLTGVPTLFSALLNHPKVQSGEADFRSIKLCMSGAAPLLQETKNRFEKVTEGRIIEGYGLTESVMATIATPALGLYKEGAIGIPLPDVEVRIAEPENEANTLPLGEVGHILIRAPQLMKGYWNEPEKTAETFYEDWLLTGDLGYLDEDGYLFLVDRLKELIKPSGFQVWPREVEEVIAQHPAVSEVGVTGMPDPKSGEAVWAWVVLLPEQKATSDELRTFCREHLASYKVPRKVVFCESLPKSAVGKVLRRMLKDIKPETVKEELVLDS